MFKFKNSKLDASTVHLHIVEMPLSISTAEINRLSVVLSKSEREKWQRYRFKKDQDNYLVARVLVRTLLSEYLNNREPGKWEFDVNRYGKPHLTNNPTNRNIYFNISHTRGYVVCVFGLHDYLGVDIELINSNIDIASLAVQYFSEEEVENLLDLPSEAQLGRFYEYWTMKEAFIKAIGMGLSMPLDHFSVRFIKENQTLIKFLEDYPFSTMTWDVKRIMRFNNCKAAICIGTTTSKLINIKVEEFGTAISHFDV